MNNIKMEINTTNAQFNITNKIRRFKMEHTSPQMEITKKLPKFTVDWDKVWAESGRKNPRYLMVDTRQKAYEKVLKAIKRIAQEGDMMMNIQNGAPDMVPVIAAENIRAAIPEVNIATMPQSLPDVTWEKGELEISWTKSSMEMTWDDDYEPDIDVMPHSVEINIRNFKKIKMDEGNKKLQEHKIDKKI